MPRRLESCLLIAAHPDDETIGAGVWMRRYRGRLTVLHITDGSPLDLRDAHAAGFWSREEYASARRKELHTALALAQVSPKQYMQLGIVDQQAYLFMHDVAARLLEIARELEVTLLMSPAYEGGHPDHDAAAFATAAVRRRLGIPHREYRLYHAAPDGSLETRQFLSNSDDPGDVLRFRTPSAD